MGLNVTSWASTFIYYIQNLIANDVSPIDFGKSGLDLVVDFDNPKGVFIVDMESLTLKT